MDVKTAFLNDKLAEVYVQ
jgi:hypothetical protein